LYFGEKPLPCSFVQLKVQQQQQKQSMELEIESRKEYQKRMEIN
jgi:hypothetical protein